MGNIWNMRFENSQKKYPKAIAENARNEIDSLEIELKHFKTDLSDKSKISGLQIKTRWDLIQKSWWSQDEK